MKLHSEFWTLVFTGWTIRLEWSQKRRRRRFLNFYTSLGKLIFQK
jgi:hypothetical protein